VLPATVREESQGAAEVLCEAGQYSALSVSSSLLAHAAAKVAGTTAPRGLTQHTTAPRFDLSALPDLQGSMMDLYMRLQRGEPVMAATPAQVTPPARCTLDIPQGAKTGSTLRSAVTVSPGPTAVEAIRARLAQLSHYQHRSSSHQEGPLTVLVSESFFEEHGAVIGELERSHHMRCVDCALESPVNLIVDATTAVCIVHSDAVKDKAQLKALVKQLTHVTFKFSRIHIVVTLEAGAPGSAGTTASREHQHSCGLLTLTQALVRFPAQTSLWQCTNTPGVVANVLAQVCQQCTARAMQIDGATGRGYSCRPFLDSLCCADARHTAHCEFLQMFPTVNYYVAALLLHCLPLRCLVAYEYTALVAAVRKVHQLHDSVEACVLAFTELTRVHVGLVAVAQF
jgi:hypothetical protein